MGCIYFLVIQIARFDSVHLTKFNRHPNIRSLVFHSSSQIYQGGLIEGLGFMEFGSLLFLNTERTQGFKIGAPEMMFSIRFL